jgi:ABC-type sugar transport system ATPase subunit
MIGRSLTDYFHKGEARAGKPALEVEGLSLTGAFEDVSFTVRSGEVLGVAGLVGCGRVELLRSIYGAGPRPHGELRVMGRAHRPKGPDSSVRLGLAMVTGDRKEEGLVLPHSVHQNLTMVRNRRLSLVPLRHGQDRHLARDLVARLRIHPPDTSVAVAQLSGGNQQKVALAKWLAISPRVLLLDEPTRGVDVGARAEIYRIIGELRESGVAVVVSSSENPELLGICDRILVLSRGRVVAELPSDATETELVQYASGALD